MARVGQETQQIVSGTMEELLPIDFGAPLHSVVIVNPAEVLALCGFAGCCLLVLEQSQSQSHSLPRVCVLDCVC